ncbi:thioesterase II family protein [Actinophytocola glycyrrhizae]|uniref:Thioesterase II family protein n=1 Tax=Actinophytocola glycyrrhizae TaxID=2044873 RepID=A0ABV9S655_9PSEU
MTFAITHLSRVDRSSAVGTAYGHHYLLLPPAGGGLATLRASADAACGREVWGVEYPGRGVRSTDPPFRAVTEVADQIMRELTDRFTKRVLGRLVLVGLSMGAFVAFEVACRLPMASGTAPAALVVIGATAPHRRDPAKYAATDDETLGRLLESDGLVAGFRSAPEAWAYALDLLRTDLLATIRYRAPAGTRAPCPLAALCGADDPSVTSVADATEAWRTWTTGPFTTLVVSGGHLGLLSGDRSAEFWSLVEQAERKVMGAAR